MSLDGGSLLASFVVSGIGFVLFEYGRRMKRMPQLGVGLVMLIYPYFVANTWVMLGVGLVLVLLLWLGLAQGIEARRVKLVRFGPAGGERPGVLVGGVRRDASDVFGDWDRTFFETGGLLRAAELLRAGELPAVPEAERWGAPVARPGKVVCVGLNYKDHAHESGVPLPAEPVLFLKAPNTVVGPYDAVRIPRGSTKTDYEVELGVVIGRPARYLASPADALASVAGYCISHDVSERELQLERGGQWTKGKSCDTFNPLGPFLATPDEVPDAQSLALTLAVNGERRQTGNTSEMAWGVERLVWYVSQFMALEGGDLISTGTPAGVGLGRKPPEFLKAGDVCELEITGLGRQRQVFEQALKANLEG